MSLVRSSFYYFSGSSFRTQQHTLVTFVLCIVLESLSCILLISQVASRCKPLTIYIDTALQEQWVAAHARVGSQLIIRGTTSESTKHGKVATRTIGTAAYCDQHNSFYLPFLFDPRQIVIDSIFLLSIRPLPRNFPRKLGITFCLTELQSVLQLQCQILVKF